jgi:type II secretory ATPase GspE/PulE/Tfp pilus assembly ATPase PilB-like protein
MRSSAPAWMDTDLLPLGEILVQREVISRDELETALRHQEETGLKLGQALVALELATEIEIAEALGTQGRVSTLRLRSGMVDREVAEKLGAERSRQYGVIAINCIAGVTTVAMEDPNASDLVDRLAQELRTEVLPAHASGISIRRCLDEIFPAQVEPGAGIDEVVAQFDPVALGLQLESKVGPPPTGDDPDRPPVMRLLDAILEDAGRERASDVHIEPRRDAMVVRFRVDGELYERLRLPKAWLRPLLSRLKILGGLDITQRRLPQDGRILTEVGGRRLDLRIATAGTLEGEGAALRVFDGGRQILALENLGFDPEQLADIQGAFSARDGFILSTGPSGSGKTTTLYGILRELNSEDRKIVTLEDPVESELEEAFQIATNPKIGLDFEAGLRSVLRLDPDVIMVGEIRDRLTAETAMTAALTGHLVLSTLATVGAAETVMRLQDLGVDRFMIADTLRAIISQRLVKRLCRSCRVPVRPPTALLRALDLVGDEGPFFAGRGCPECRHTGYRGRLALSEIMTMNPAIYPLVGQRRSSGEIREAAVASGMRTLLADGIAKARAGQTSLEEIHSICHLRSGS